MDNTIIQQGRFTSDGTAKILDIRSDIDWMVVINDTQWSTTQATGRGVRFEWQRGLADGYGWEYTKANSSSNALQGEKLTSGGFTLLDTSDQAPEAAIVGTTITKAGPPVCSATNTFSNGDRVRIFASDEMDQLNGLDFTVGSVSGSDFELSYIDTNTGNFTASTAFQVRKLPNNPIFFPRLRYITAVTTGATTEVQMSVTHGMSVGDAVRFKVPSAFGMTQLDDLLGTISAVNTTTNTITVDIDSQAFTAFAWPTAATFTNGSNGQWAQVIPVGNDSVNSLADATDNVSIIGMELGAGIDGPAGSSNDVIYWRAGKSFSVDNS